MSKTLVVVTLLLAVTVAISADEMFGLTSMFKHKGRFGYGKDLFAEKIIVNKPHKTHKSRNHKKIGADAKDNGLDLHDKNMFEHAGLEEEVHPKFPDDLDGPFGPFSDLDGPFSRLGRFGRNRWEGLNNPCRFAGDCTTDVKKEKMKDGKMKETHRQCDKHDNCRTFTVIKRR